MDAVSRSESHTDTLRVVGFVHVSGPFASVGHAWSTARSFVEAATRDCLEVLGDFVIPPPEGPASRGFQTLHFDFGLPLNPVAATDLARYTALHIPASAQPSDAVTRLVPLRPLLGAIGWPDSEGLIARFTAYGHSHGAWYGAAGYVEGSLARIVEAAFGRPPMLPSVKDEPDFLCGTEFATLGEELAFFARRGLPLAAVGLEVLLQPGDLLVFDNLALAHGRRGTRQPGELHQRIFGHPALGVAEQIEFRDRVLAAFMS